MKLAMLIESPLRQQLFTETAMQRLHNMVDLVLPEDSLTEESMPKLLDGAELLITSWGAPCINRDYLEMMPDLKLVVHAAGSVKGIVSPELFVQKVRVSNCASVLSRGVSETALGLIICTLKDVFAGNERIYEGGWKAEPNPVRELYGQTIGIVGAGYAGGHLIELLQSFSVNVIACDPVVDQETLVTLGAKKVDFETLLKTSDVISLHAPSIPSTHHMINQETINMMKDGAILINTARGSLIDEEALADALENNKLKCACLDVTDPEPPAKDHRLRKLPNCIMTPHIAGLANNGLLKIGDHVTAEIARFLNGDPLMTEVDSAKLSTLA